MAETLLEIPFPGRAFPAPAGGPSRAAPRRLTSFVAGPENRLPASVIHGFMLGPAEEPQYGSSPLEVGPHVVTLAGQSGVGKSHLLRGLVDDWNSARGEGAAEYLPAGDFRRELLDAMKRDEVVAFRRRIRGRRLLAIDNLNELPGDGYLMEELRNTLDDRENAADVTVLATSTPPNLMPNLSVDVRSRLAGGLVVPLEPPGRDARQLLVRQAAAALGCEISNAAMRQLADGLDGTAHVLFAALSELVAEEDQSPRIEVPQVERFLARRASRRATLRDIIAIVARYYGLPQKLLKSSSRRHAAVVARSTIVYLARVVAGASYEQIGRALGGRDHSTIMYNFRTIDRDRRRDGRTQETLDELRRVLVSC